MNIIKPSLLTIALCGCIGFARQVNSPPPSADDIKALDSYNALVAVLRRKSTGTTKPEDFQSYIDADAWARLEDLINRDNKAMTSLLAKCGLLDVLGCFSSGINPKRSVTTVVVNEDVKLACIVYSKPYASEGLIAIVYMISNRSSWRLLSTSQIEMDRVSHEKAVRSPETVCWKSGAGQLN